MVKPREIRRGDIVRVTRIPPDLDDRAGIGTPQVFESAVGKTFRVEGIGEYGHLELVVSQTGTGSSHTSDTIWIDRSSSRKSERFERKPSNQPLQPTARWRCASISILISALSTVAEPRARSGG
jgi:hypothetical protein